MTVGLRCCFFVLGIAEIFPDKIKKSFILHGKGRVPFLDVAKGKTFPAAVYGDVPYGIFPERIIYQADAETAYIRMQQHLDDLIVAVGGEEANIFAGDLFRMYIRYCENKGWHVKILDESPTGVGGYSYVSFVVSGDDAYSRLKFESGVHRVQRVPKTEANGRIHTSTATVVVMPQVEANEVNINPADLKVDRYRSQGAGGQNVNKTESAVRITHIPSGIVVSCQTEKSQIQNHEICMQMLASKLAQLEEEKKAKTEAQYRSKIGSGDRNEKIRTYNYPQNRVTDHRIGFTIQQLDRVINGDLDAIVL